MTLGLEADQPVVGMVPLDALRGATDFDGDRAAVREAMHRDAHRLAAGGALPRRVFVRECLPYRVDPGRIRNNPSVVWSCHTHQ